MCPANRSGACPHRCAVAALRHNVALCAPSQASCTAGRAAASAAVRAARRITHVMSPVGSASHSVPRSGIAGLRACMRTHAHKHGRVLTHAPACAQPRCVCAHVGSRIGARVARGIASRLRHQHRHAPAAKGGVGSSKINNKRSTAPRLKVCRGLAVVVPVSHRSQARQGRGELLRKP